MADQSQFSYKELHPHLSPISTSSLKTVAHPLGTQRGCFKALDQLTQEEQLTYADGGYSFMVALYRRWISWYYPPERFRESL
ncbi:MAG: hypothetical protein SD837_20750 [Candidatus Electrothrix scaldis]|nr:MAG: hypothetical protein SD837_20750 [Candidatus Electrothrix sp. GW3-3]